MPTDEQIEAVAEALWQAESIRASDRPRLEDWADAGDDVHKKWRFMARAALEAAERVAPKDRWFSDEESAYESPGEAAEAACLTLGQSIVLSENVSLNEERWQLVPVTDNDVLCPCGKPEGCGDFLGVDCDAVRDKAWRWIDLPKEWRR